MKSLKTTSQALVGFAALYALYDVVYHFVAKGTITVRTVAELWKDNAGADGFAAGKSALRSMTNSNFTNFICDQYVPVLLLLLAGVIYALFHVACAIKGKDKTNRI